MAALVRFFRKPQWIVLSVLFTSHIVSFSYMHTLNGRPFYVCLSLSRHSFGLAIQIRLLQEVTILSGIDFAGFLCVCLKLIRRCLSIGVMEIHWLIQMWMSFTEGTSQSHLDLDDNSWEIQPANKSKNMRTSVQNIKPAALKFSTLFMVNGSCASMEIWQAQEQ